MDNSYFGFAPNSRHEASQHIMAPPPLPSGHADQGHLVDFAANAVASSSDIHPNPIGYPWQLPTPLFPADHASGLGLGNPSGSSTQRPRSSAHAQKPPGRTTIRSDAWAKHKLAIHKLWIEEDRPLSETMAVMSQKHNFHASLDQYKKQISKWKWSKYIPAKTGSWMLDKIDERRRELGKDTQFQYYRGQVLTETSIRPRIDRKKFGDNSQEPLDATTPSDIEYTTPRSLVHSPLESRTASIRTTQPAWIPPITSGQGQPMMRLIWNGRTKADYRAQYEEGLGEERSGRSDEAEAKFRSALEGLYQLLSATHLETVTVAYRLASFFAEHARMQDADKVLDWLTQAHLEEYGFYSSRTVDHLANVSKMFRDWGRPEDATEFLQRALHELEEDRPGPNSARPSVTADMTSVGEQERTSYFSIPSEGPIDPSLLRIQIHQITRGSQQGEGTETALLRLIRHCEQFPDKLIEHSLLCYPPLLNHYQNIGDVIKQSDTLDRAEIAIWDFLRSEHDRTKDGLIACVQLAKHLVKASRLESADDIFSQIECDAQDTFGSDHPATIWFLEHIGTFYQNEGRWQDAAPRFEHALAARISRYGSRDESVRHLEDALENRHFESYMPSKRYEQFRDCENERLINRKPAPSFIFLGRRAWQLN